jgi:hypothetical protein
MFTFKKFIYFFTITIGFVAVSSLQAIAQSRPGITDRRVAVGKTVTLSKLLTYESDRGCVPMVAPVIDTSPTPKLGTVSSKLDKVTTNGPCGKMEYPVLTISYKAGLQAGTEDFEVFYYFTRGRNSKKFSLTVVGPNGRNAKADTDVPAKKVIVSSSKKPEKEERVKSLASPDRKNVQSRNDVSPDEKQDLASDKKELPIIGRYVNNLGNEILIEKGFVYFTGRWNKEKVARKPFAIISFDGNEFQWGTYKCVGHHVELRCSNTKREQVVLYRKVK